MRTYFGEAVAVKDKGVQQLSRGQGHEHPTPPPPRLVPSPAIVLEFIVGKFDSAGGYVDGNRDAELVRGVDSEGKPGQAGADSRREAGGERFGNAGVPPTEWCGVWGEKIGAEAREEAEKQTVEEEDQR